MARVVADPAEHIVGIVAQSHPTPYNNEWERNMAAYLMGRAAVGILPGTVPPTLWMAGREGLFPVTLRGGRFGVGEVPVLGRDAGGPLPDGSYVLLARSRTSCEETLGPTARGRSILQRRARGLLMCDVRSPGASAP